VPTTVEFVDIAGLVRGASKGEGLGNKFLANIRETDAICQVRGVLFPSIKWDKKQRPWQLLATAAAAVIKGSAVLRRPQCSQGHGWLHLPGLLSQVVRCFEDDDIVHVSGKVDPLDDIDVINLELALADLSQIEKRLDRLRKGEQSNQAVIVL
jgi:hypothetical protein